MQLFLAFLLMFGLIFNFAKPANMGEAIIVNAAITAGVIGMWWWAIRMWVLLAKYGRMIANGEATLGQWKMIDTYHRWEKAINKGTPMFGNTFLKICTMLVITWASVYNFMHNFGM